MGWVIDDEDAGAFLERFTQLLSSSDCAVQLSVCRVLEAFLSCSDSKKRQEDRHTIISFRAVPSLIGILEQARTQELRVAAGQLLLSLATDMTQAEQRSLLSLSQTALDCFQAIVQQDIKRRRAMLDESSRIVKQQEQLLGLLSLLACLSVF